jgi:transposase
VDDFHLVSWHTAIMIPGSLPNLDGLDPEALKALLIAKHLESLEQHKSDTEQIEHLKLVIEKYRRMIFGRKSEKLTGELEQLEFRLEELETAQAAEEAAQAATETTQPSSTQTDSKRRSRPARKPLPEDLPREVVTHLPAHNNCPDCGGALRQFGEDVSEQLERIPASFKVIRHVRPKFACASCESVVEAPAPARPIDRGLPGPGLLAHVLFPSMVTTSRFIVSLRSMPAKVLISINTGRLGGRGQRVINSPGR